MMTLLRVRDLQVRFRVRTGLASWLKPRSARHLPAVRGVSFDLGEGESFAVVGESGSGKSTLAHALTGLVPVHRGEAVYRSRPIAVHSRHQLGEVAIMFQDPVGSLSPRLKVRSLIDEPLQLRGLDPKRRRAEIGRLLELVGLNRRLGSRHPHELSGGQARRVGLARALALAPKLLIADEPTAGLDVSVQGEVLNLMSRLQRERGLSLLVITHNLSIVRHVAQRMAIMYLGRFVEQGPCSQVFERPRHPYTQALLAANPAPDPDAPRQRITLPGDVPSPLRIPPGCAFHDRCPEAQELCRRQEPNEEGDRHRFCCHFPIQH